MNTDEPSVLGPTEQRQQWLRTLACSNEDELSRALADINVASAIGTAVALRKPEVGLVMVTGRVGGSGEPFGLGEMTITRCVVQVGDVMGVGYVRGRAPQHAQNIALTDAMLQSDLHDEIVAYVVEPLAQRQLERAALRSADVAGTQVQFLTMVRGN
jgi:alpha-D-ribose 1-methylphosphonate 5-triphosphate synthase subunit PhnG